MCNVCDFACDDVPLREIGVIENSAKRAFYQQMLHQHLLHGGGGEVWVNRVAAVLVKSGEHFVKVRVLLQFGLDEVRRPLSECAHLRFEVGYCHLPFGDVVGTVSTKRLKDFGELRLIPQVCLHYYLAVLIEDSAFRILEEGIV